MEERAPFDRIAADSCTISISKFTSENRLIRGEIVPIKFQFPPRLTSDNKQSNWDNENKTLAWEPIATWKGSSARKVTIEITYIVTGGEWSVQKIMDITREFKRYHYGRVDQAYGAIQTMEINLYDSLIGIDASNGKIAQFRIGSTDVKQSETFIVATGNNSDQNFTWPLKTVITLDAHLVTRVGTKQEIQIDIADIPAVEWF